MNTQGITQDLITCITYLFNSNQTYVGCKIYVSDNTCRRQRHRMSKRRHRFQIVRPLGLVSLDIKHYSPQAIALAYFFGILINSENCFGVRLFSCKLFMMTS